MGDADDRAQLILLGQALAQQQVCVSVQETGVVDASAAGAGGDSPPRAEMRGGGGGNRDGSERDNVPAEAWQRAVGAEGRAQLRAAAVSEGEGEGECEGEGDEGKGEGEGGEDEGDEEAGAGDEGGGNRTGSELCVEVRKGHAYKLGVSLGPREGCLQAAAANYHALTGATFTFRAPLKSETKRGRSGMFRKRGGGGGDSGGGGSSGGGTRERVLLKASCNKPEAGGTLHCELHVPRGLQRGLVLGRLTLRVGDGQPLAPVAVAIDIKGHDYSPALAHATRGVIKVVAKAALAAAAAAAVTATAGAAAPIAAGAAIAVGAGASAGQRHIDKKCGSDKK
jgi:hypothetical protein